MYRAAVYRAYTVYKYKFIRLRFRVLWRCDMVELNIIRCLTRYHHQMQELLTKQE